MGINVILLAVIILIVICIIYVLLRVSYKEWKKKVYVYPKTGNLYMPLYRCKLKCPTTREWFDAVIYQSMEDEKYYVRERADFLDKFVKLSDWKNGSNK